MRTGIRSQKCLGFGVARSSTDGMIYIKCIDTFDLYHRLCLWPIVDPPNWHFFVWSTMLTIVLIKSSFLSILSIHLGRRFLSFIFLSWANRSQAYYNISTDPTILLLSMPSFAVCLSACLNTTVKVRRGVVCCCSKCGSVEDPHCHAHQHLQEDLRQSRHSMEVSLARPFFIFRKSIVIWAS